MLRPAPLIKFPADGLQQSGTLRPDARNGYFAGGHGDFSAMLDPSEAPRQGGVVSSGPRPRCVRARDRQACRPRRPLLHGRRVAVGARLSQARRPPSLPLTSGQRHGPSRDGGSWSLRCLSEESAMPRPASRDLIRRLWTVALVAGLGFGLSPRDLRAQAGDRRPGSKPIDGHAVLTARGAHADGEAVPPRPRTCRQGQDQGGERGVQADRGRGGDAPTDHLPGPEPAGGPERPDSGVSVAARRAERAAAAIRVRPRQQQRPDVPESGPHADPADRHSAPERAGLDRPGPGSP